MEKKKQKGRPKQEIKFHQVDQYLRAGCTGTSIAAFLGVCADTLYRACQQENKMTFAAYAAQKRAEGNDLLKLKQYEAAMNGDRAMLIFLGKVRLEQKEGATLALDVTTGGKAFRGFDFLKPLAAEDDDDEA